MTPAGTALSVEVLDRRTAIELLPPQLDELAQRALESNVFAESVLFVPALELIDTDVALHVVCVREPAGRLMGVAAFVLESVRPGVPLPLLRSWRHRYCFLGTPLLDSQAAAQVLEALSDWLASGRSPAGGIEWANVRWDGPFGALLRASLSRPRQWSVDLSTKRRALLEREHGSTPALSAKHAKECRRLERRLADQGNLRYQALGREEDAQRWIDDFLLLEGSGWKGSGQTAIRSRKSDAEFFRRVLTRAAAAGRLQMLRMTLDDRVIAMKLNLRARGSSFALKIAYDEGFSRYSPGVLLELYNMKVFMDEPGDILQMDSCAEPGNAMIERLWSSRRELAFVTAARRGALLRAFVRLRPMQRQIRRGIRPARVAG